MKKLYSFHVEDFTETELTGISPVTPSWDNGKYTHFKCAGCGGSTTSLYMQAHTREKAKALILVGQLGVCDECMSEYLSEAGYEM